jgi:hypothetical protein
MSFPEDVVPGKDGDRPVWAGGDVYIRRCSLWMEGKAREVSLKYDVL